MAWFVVRFKIHISSSYRIVVEYVYVCVYVKKPSRKKKLHSASHSYQTLKKGQKDREKERTKEEGQKKEDDSI